jgi:hypothetical protein
MIQLLLGLPLVLGFALCSSHSRAVDAVVEHDLSVRIHPQQQSLHVIDNITLPVGAARELEFSLHTGLHPKTTSRGVKLTRLNTTDDALRQQFKVHLPELMNSFTIVYEGEIFHPLQTFGKEQARGYKSTPGLISAEGVYLAGGSYWFAAFEAYPYLRFNMRVESPAGWKTVSQGQGSSQTVQDGMAIDNWKTRSPQEEIYLIAAPFTEYNRQSGNITAQVFLRQPDAKLSAKYLEATHRYVTMYEELLGPYPYSKFALVENFWETGFGMPSFTLLGSRVIRLPFILNSSYPHEILHNWWGNGVYVDYARGNWSEGLTTYLADHLIKQQQGQAVEYRLQSLQKYRDYAAANRDFPLVEFRGRHSSATEAVGYGKTLMMFNMLRQQIGDDLFVKSLQQFYRDYQFKIASFDDLRVTFEKVGGIKLDQFFRQWTDRTGAPDLGLHGTSKVETTTDGYQVSFRLKQSQPGEAYHLEIPVTFTLQGNEKAKQTVVTMSQKDQQFDMQFESRPLRIDVDPEFDLFRKLAVEETPPAFTQVFGARSLLVVLPGAAEPPLRTAWESFAEKLSMMGPEHADIKWDHELSLLPNKAVIILGWENRFSHELKSLPGDYEVTIHKDGLNIGNTRIPRDDHSVALTTRYQNNDHTPRAFIATDLADALPGLARKLPHYHKYSYLAFSGEEPENTHKGRWPVSRSPMTVLLEGHANRGELAKRPALIESESDFDAERMTQTIRALTSEVMRGRGFAEPGLEEAANYIAQAFREAGLQPAGDHPGSYFQTWSDQGGDPARSVLLRNVVGVIPGSHSTLKQENVVIGAHYDHLGTGWPDVRNGNLGQIHYGADDNASGIAVMLELARVLVDKMNPDRNILFVAFSGEEAGRKGSAYYTKHQQEFPVSKSIGMVNLDTVGRLGNNSVLVLGGGSASEWPHIFRGVGFVTGISISMVSEDLDASDHVSFHEAGVPAIQLFSGVNADYHRPTDTAEKIDSAGLVKIARVSKEVLDYLAARPQSLSSNLPQANNSGRAPTSGARKVSLGSIPDFTFDGDGYRLDGVVADSPAAIAGLKKGDIIVRLDDTEIHGLRDVSAVLKTMTVDQSIVITYLRQGQLATAQATLISR